jgi:hypothetical protein
MPRTRIQGVRFWEKKIEENGQRSFGCGASNSAVRTFHKRVNEPHRSVLKAPNLSVLSKMLEVHRRFTSRVLALLTGSGLVTVETWSPVRIVFTGNAFCGIRTLLKRCEQKKFLRKCEPISFGKITSYVVLVVSRFLYSASRLTTSCP